MERTVPFRSWRTLTGVALLSANMLAAQDDCDSLQIVSLSYAPFTDTAMQVVVLNTGTELFGYPRFSLVDDGGDTLAQEPINFFGIGWGEQTHRMDLLTGVALPATPFTGTLVLHYSIVDGGAICTFPISADDLCPPACDTLQVFLYAQFGSITTSSFPWSMTDSTGTVVGSGTLSIDIDSLQQDLDPLCLVPGSYTLHIEQPLASGLEFQFGVTQDAFMINGPSGVLPAGGSADLAFDYYPACIGLGTGIAEVHGSEPLLTLTDGILTISDPQNRALGEVVLLDAMGRCLRRVAAPSSSVTMDLSTVATGVHLVSIVNTTSTTTRRILVP